MACTWPEQAALHAGSNDLHSPPFDVSDLSLEYLAADSEVWDPPPDLSVLQGFERAWPTHQHQQQQQQVHHHPYSTMSPSIPQTIADNSHLMRGLHGVSLATLPSTQVVSPSHWANAIPSSLPHQETDSHWYLSPDLSPPQDWSMHLGGAENPFLPRVTAPFTMAPVPSSAIADPSPQLSAMDDRHSNPSGTSYPSSNDAEHTPPQDTLEDIDSNRNSAAFNTADVAMLGYDIEAAAAAATVTAASRSASVSTAPPHPPPPSATGSVVASSSASASSSSTTAKRKGGRKVGGRQPGSHLNENTRARARQMREVSSCWRCVLQRDKCTPGEICLRCQKRSQRNVLDWGISCDRTRLPDLSLQLLPASIRSSHDRDTFKSFCLDHVHGYGKVPITIHLNIGHGPIWHFRAFEAIPKNIDLLQQVQYVINDETHKSERQIKFSPPLALDWSHESLVRKTHESVLDEFMTQHLDDFPHTYYLECSDKFPQHILQGLVDLYRDPSCPSTLRPILDQLLRFIVLTYIMGRTFTLKKGTQPETFDHLTTLNPHTRPYVAFCSPRIANKQMKHHLCTLHFEMLTHLLNTTQQLLRGSTPRTTWLASFCVLLGLAIALEDIQRLVFINIDDRRARGQVSRVHGAALAANYADGIDVKFAFLCSLFKIKYNKTLNPLRDAEYAHLKDWLGVSGTEFVRRISSLVKEKEAWLSERAQAPLAMERETTARLMGRFLGGVWRD